MLDRNSHTIHLACRHRAKLKEDYVWSAFDPALANTGNSQSSP